MQRPQLHESESKDFPLLQKTVSFLTKGSLPCGSCGSAVEGLIPSAPDEEVISVLKSVGFSSAVLTPKELLKNAAPEAKRRASRRRKAKAASSPEVVVVELCDSSDDDKPVGSSAGKNKKVQQSSAGAAAIELDSDSDNGDEAVAVAMSKSASPPGASMGSGSPFARTDQNGSPICIQLALQSSATDHTAVCKSCSAVVSSASGRAVPGFAQYSKTSRQGKLQPGHADSMRFVARLWPGVQQVAEIRRASVLLDGLSPARLATALGLGKGKGVQLAAAKRTSAAKKTQGSQASSGIGFAGSQQDSAASANTTLLKKAARRRQEMEDGALCKALKAVRRGIPLLQSQWEHSRAATVTLGEADSQPMGGTGSPQVVDLLDSEEEEEQEQEQEQEQGGMAGAKARSNGKGKGKGSASGASLSCSSSSSASSASKGVSLFLLDPREWEAVCNPLLLALLQSGTPPADGLALPAQQDGSPSRAGAKRPRASASAASSSSSSSSSSSGAVQPPAPSVLHAALLPLLRTGLLEMQARSKVFFAALSLVEAVGQCPSTVPFLGYAPADEDEAKELLQGVSKSRRSGSSSGAAASGQKQSASSHQLRESCIRRVSPLGWIRSMCAERGYQTVINALRTDARAGSTEMSAEAVRDGVQDGTSELVGLLSAGSLGGCVRQLAQQAEVFRSTGQRAQQAAAAAAASSKKPKSKSKSKAQASGASIASAPRMQGTREEEAQYQAMLSLGRRAEACLEVMGRGMRRWASACWVAVERAIAAMQEAGLPGMDSKWGGATGAAAAGGQAAKEGPVKPATGAGWPAGCSLVRSGPIAIRDAASARAAQAKRHTPAACMPRWDTVFPTEEQRQAYKRVMEPLVYQTVEGLTNGHMAAKLVPAGAGGATRMRRLMRVSSELSGLPRLALEYESAVLARVDQARMDVMRAAIMGPSGSPYSCGVLLVDVCLPASYPDVPPVAKFRSPSTARVNPNLYVDGKVCLSLLGTWSGPGWRPKESTLAQVLLAIQSQILVADPYYNEPGHESGYGQQGGRRRSGAYNAHVRAATMQHFILEPLQRPPAEFREAVLAHFRLKADEVRRQCDRWMEEARLRMEVLQRSKGQPVGNIAQIGGYTVFREPSGGWSHKQVTPEILFAKTKKARDGIFQELKRRGW